MCNVFVNLQSWLARPLRRDERGATAVEYGLIVALVAVAIILGVRTLGTDVKLMFTEVANDVAAVL